MAEPIRFDCVAAADAAGGIGKANDLPWPRLSEDLRFLRRITSEAPPGKRNAVIMGRLTWESVPSGRQPLPDRLNVVVSRSPLALPAGMLAATSLPLALELARARPEVDGLFVIGGAQIFRPGVRPPRLPPHLPHPAGGPLRLRRLPAAAAGGRGAGRGAGPPPRAGHRLRDPALETSDSVPSDEFGVESPA